MLEGQDWWNQNPNEDEKCANCGETYYRHRWSGNLSENRKNCPRVKFGSEKESNFWTRLQSLEAAPLKTTQN